MEAEHAAPLGLVAFGGRSTRIRATGIARLSALGLRAADRSPTMIRIGIIFVAKPRIGR